MHEDSHEPTKGANKADAVVLAFDFGTRRIGVAVGQCITQTATPLDMLPAKNGDPDWSALTKLVDEWQPTVMVVGLPLNMDGSEQPITKAARHFANSLKNRFHIPVEEVDERLTTAEARGEVFAEGGFKALQKKQIDSVAAKLILECWFDILSSANEEESS